MTRPALRLTLVAAFGIAVGHLAWNALLGSPPTPAYFVGGDVTALCGTEPAQRVLYLRRKLYLSQQPTHAWVTILGRDHLEVYVNGRLLEKRSLEGYPVAVVADLAPYLRVGTNVLAIAARQATLGQPPVVAVEGAYVLTDGEHAIGSDDQWRCSGVFERRAYWWFAPEFDDRPWPPARLTPCRLWARAQGPPGVATAAGVGRWITPNTSSDGSADVRRAFDVAGRPRQAWLRLTATASYRLAVNGVLIDQQEDQLATTLPSPPVRRSYDITPLVRQGRNVLALVVTGTAGPPHLLLDAEVEDQAGRLYRFGTDGEWLGRAGLNPDWLEPRADDAPAGEPCFVEAGNLGVLPWQPQRRSVQFSLPAAVVARRMAEQLGVMVLAALVMLLACRLAARAVSALGREAGAPVPAGVVYLALVPATLAIAVGVLATYDPRVGPQDVYRGEAIFLAVASVLAQWGLMAWLAHRRAWSRRPLLGRRARPQLARALMAATVFGLVAVGFWLRIRGIDSEALQWDEAENYHALQGMMERGFPSQQHLDLPVEYTHTSELMFPWLALSYKLFDSERYVIRFPPVVFSTLTILLLFFVGRRMFNAPVGLMAAGMHAFSPIIIAMSDFGRYFAQLQFMTLLTVYLFWTTVRGAGAIDRRALGWTALSFIGLYLSWEGGALAAPGMVVAALVQRRGRLGTVLCSFWVWLAILAVGTTALLQSAFLTFQQTQFIWYGTSLSDVTLRPMWLFPAFQPLYFVWESSWNRDGLVPMLGCLAAGVLAIRHGCRRPLRLLWLIFVTTCLVMALLLPNATWRYIHHMMALLILLNAAVVVAGIRQLFRLVREPGRPAGWPAAYARGLGVLVAVVFVAVGSGITLDLVDLPGCRVEGYSFRTYKFPNLGDACAYVRDHAREGDVVLATDPPQVRFLMGIGQESERYKFYWPATTLYLPATLADTESVPRDRRDGTEMIDSLERLQQVFARHRRIWYVLQPERHQENIPDVSAFLEEHMEVVYEDADTLVLFRGDHHWTAKARLKNENALKEAEARFLP